MVKKKFPLVQVVTPSKATKKVSVKSISNILRVLDTLAKRSPTIGKAPVRVPFNPTQQQQFMMTFLNGKKSFGTGENLPEINGTLTSGGGLIKHLQKDKTGRMFGF